MLIFERTLSRPHEPPSLMGSHSLSTLSRDLSGPGFGGGPYGGGGFGGFGGGFGGPYMGGGFGGFGGGGPYGG